MRHHIPRLVRSMLLCASVLLAGTTAPASARELPRALAAVGAPTMPSDSSLALVDINGTGRYETAACLLCGAGVLGLGGASVAGLFFLAALLPDAVAGCATVCLIAYAAQ